jgi:NAD(P)-dependent dehydrogenase (short-subunit alcohol dehydrogenase family)
MTRLKGSVAVITGAARGLGRGIAEALAGEGVRLVLSDLDGNQLRNTEEELVGSGADVISVAADVTSEASVQLIAAVAVERFGGVDIVCNNAGIWSINSLLDSDLREWRRVHDVNFWGTIYGIRTFIPILLENKSGGHIVNVSSSSGLVATPFRAPYVASKYAIVGVTESLRLEARASGFDLRVTLVCPGKLDTAIFTAFQTRNSRVSSQTADLSAAAALVEEADGMSPRLAGEMVKNAIAEDLPLVLPGISPFIRRWVEHRHRVELEAIERDLLVSEVMGQSNDGADEY